VSSNKAGKPFLLKSSPKPSKNNVFLYQFKQNKKPYSIKFRTFFILKPTDRGIVIQEKSLFFIKNAT